jgi:hypothetical protein
MALPRWSSLGMLAAALALSGPLPGYDFERHQWRDRLLMLVAPTPADPAAVAQRSRLAQRSDAVRDRELVIVQLYREYGLVGDQRLDTAAVAEIRQRLAAAEDARLLILIGKDGGVKRRAPLATDLSELFRQIDGMPMRQAEMAAKRRAGEPVTPAD